MASETETPTVWVIEKGSYSDYRVVGVYDSEEKARAVADRLNRGGGSYDEATVAEWDLNPGFDLLNKRFKSFHIVMLRDGTVERITENDSDPWSYEIPETSVRLWERTKAPAYVGKGVPDALSGSILARDEKQAIKIANEKRVQMIAGGHWP